MRTASLTALLLAAASQPAFAQAPWSAEGRLEAGDRQDSEGYRYDEHRVRLEAGRRYRIGATSDDFDTVVQLFERGRTTPIAEDDDGGDGLNSRLSFTPARSGDYTLRIRSFAADATGAYRLVAEIPPPLPEPVVVAGNVEITAWNVYRGRLDAGDAQREGARFDDYLVTLAAGQELLVRADSPDFDTVVQIFAADARDGEMLAMDDDGGGGLNSMLLFTAAESGDYIVRVTGFDDSQQGDYRLRIAQ